MKESRKLIINSKEWKENFLKVSLKYQLHVSSRSCFDPHRHVIAIW